MSTVTLSGTYELLACCHAGCGVTFGVPKWWEIERRRDHTWWYCPNGHQQHFASKSDLDRLKAANLRLESQLEFQRNRTRDVAVERDEAKRSLTATKGVVTKIKKRVEHGVCIHCNRTFQDLARHMESKHAAEIVA